MIRKSIRWLNAPGFRLQVKTLLLGGALVACSVQLASCGYTTRSMISDKFKTIYITPFTNKMDVTKDGAENARYRIYRPMLNTEITKKVINQYLWDGNLRPAKEETADLILKADLIEYRKEPLRYDENDEVAEYRMAIVANLILWDNKENAQVWQETGFTGETTYFPGTSTLANVVTKTDEQAVTDAVADLARRIVERTVEQW
ncbi:MAG: hypothetical protein KKC84_06370 [Candidatus Omnitrophica bacterium]|nr:hypothetical protein [Candidatus Omnitrophota bacterium]